MPPHLEAALGVIEAVQSLGELVDVAEILATLARRLTELVDASACLVSLVDVAGGTVRDRAGYARAPHEWPRAAEEYTLADYPRTAGVIETGVPYGCSLGIGRPDGAESARLRDLGYRALLMLRLRVDGEPYGLIEIYDEHRRTFAQAEIRLCQALATEAGKAVSRARMAERLEEAYFSTLGALAAALEAKDAYTSDHAMHIAELAGAVCERLDIPPGESRIVRLAALLHDIGKIGVPEVILRKPGPLTARETAKMRQHAEIGGADPEARPPLRRARPARPRDARALGRHRLSGGPGPTADPARRQGDLRVRRLSRDDRGPRLPAGNAGGRCDGRDRAMLGHAVRPRVR